MFTDVAKQFVLKVNACLQANSDLISLQLILYCTICALTYFCTWSLNRTNNLEYFL